VSNPLSKMVEGLSPQKRRLLRELLLPASEPIAIVGMACRFPGADGTGAFWKLLSEGGDAVSEVPADRWDADRYFQAGDATPGKTNSRWGGFVNNLDKFDAQFFGVSPREAIAMDPQHRLLLEVAWEAFENAGETKESLAGSATGVFVGIGACEYSQLRSRNTAHIDLFSGTGIASNIAAGRLSYFFDLKGPCVSIDTACSSSLVAVHYALQSLRNGETDVALAAGVNAILSPWMAILSTQMRATAADGRCKAFDARADGYVRGEGCGAVVLKRLSDARRSSDRIFAVISGSSVNQDGRSASLTAPNLLSQRDVVANALNNARTSPHEVDFIEAHGTGTALGDPIELEALKSVFGALRHDGSRCAVGSVKTNIGHLEAAAGIASLIKTVLALCNEAIPPNLHFQTLNSHVCLDDTSLFVPDIPVPWRRSERRRVAGISSFGWSGTNAHLIVAEAPEPPSTGRDEGDRDYVVPISARTARGLTELARAYRDFLSDTSVASKRLSDIAYTAGVRRTHHDFRLALIGNSPRTLTSQLDTFLSGSGRPARSRPANAHSLSKIALVFSGYGSQWIGMGIELAREEPVFRAMLKACEQEFRAHVDWSLSEQLAASQQSVLDKPGAIDIVQPAIFAIQCSLSALLQSWGITPDAVVGHSMGEIAAAYAAGTLDLSDAARIICHRSRLIAAGRSAVGMAQIDGPAEQLAPEIDRYDGRLSIAAVNQPGSILIAGDLNALDELIDHLSGLGYACHRMNVSGATHCPQTDAMVPELMRALEGLQPKPAACALYSTVLGRRLAHETVDAQYWGANLRQPVQFGSAIEQMLAAGYKTFIELSPRALLGDAIAANARGLGCDVTVLPTLRKGRRGRAALLHSLGQLFELGYKINWSAFHSDAGQVIDLPGYVWQRQRYWLGEQEELQTSGAPIRAAQRIVQEAPDMPAAPFLSAVWERAQERDRSEPSPGRKHWIMLTDEGGIGERLGRKLATVGADCTTVRVGPAYRDLGGGVYEARSWSRDDLDMILESVQRNCGGEPICIGYFWALDVAPSQQLWNEGDEDIACRSIVNLISVLAERGGSTGARLFIVTRGAENLGDPADGSKPVPAQALVHGLARTIRIELPELRCVCLDLDSSQEEVAIDRIMEELVDPDEEEEIVLRRGRRYVRRLARVQASNTSSYAPRSEGTYLITGGLGGLGLRVAQWLAARGAKSLVLVGRSEATAACKEQIARMKSDGVQVAIRTADVARLDQLSPIFDEIDRCLPTLAGIVHAAGVIRDAMLVKVEPETISQVIAPKARGAWNLHTLTEGRDLDLFVLFSSAASLFGSPTQGVYAAANAFLDALAHYRRGKGAKGLSINWGPWSDVGGAAARSQWVRRLQTFGIGALSPDDAINALEQAIMSDSPQMAIVDFHYERLQSAFPAAAAKPFYAEFARASQSTTSEPSTQFLDGVIAEGSTPGRRQLLESYLQTRIGEVLRTPPSDMEIQAPLHLFGIDSLTSMELRAVLERELRMEIPARLPWDHPTIETIAAFLEAKITDRHPMGLE
jgi:acyl transferase domain-containing protein/acyl carrier protein